jgi:hypothetical protein
VDEIKLVMPVSETHDLSHLRMALIDTQKGSPVLFSVNRPDRYPVRASGHPGLSGALSSTLVGTQRKV